MISRPMKIVCLAATTAALLAGPAMAQVGGVNSAAGAAGTAGVPGAGGGGPSAATIGGGHPTSGMAGSATGATGLSGSGTNGIGTSGFANPGIQPTTPGVMTAPGTGAAQPVTGVPTPSLPAQVPGRVAPRSGGPR